MKAIHSITAHPNPLLLSPFYAGPFPVGEATLSWTSDREVIEVRVGAPDGPLLSRTGAVGSATTGPWVRDGMSFYLQDVSMGRNR